ncbi:MAG: nucleotidyltransferase family protein [Deltaproteobacteria bacterium]
MTPSEIFLRRRYNERMVALAGRGEGQGQAEGHRDRDGREFFRAALRERTASLLSRSLRGGRDETVRAFEDTYRATTARYLRQSYLFQQVFRKLEEGAVDFIVFKGPVLAETVYQDPGVRPMTDVDILVRPLDLARAHRLLADLGYSCGLPETAVARLNPYHNSLLYHEPQGAIVHLYWHLVNLYLGPRRSLDNVPMEKIWGAAEGAQVCGCRVRTLCPADTFVYLCLHAFGHGFTPLILIFDLDAVRRGRDVSFWQQVVARAHECGWQRYVHHALTVLAGWGFPVDDIPSFVHERLKPGHISYFERVFITAALCRRPAGLFGRLRWALLGMQPGLVDRLRFLFENIFVPRRDMAVVRQKDPARIRPSDYLHRLFAS